jgi:hypothetical protein
MQRCLACATDDEERCLCANPLQSLKFIVFFNVTPPSNLVYEECHLLWYKNTVRPSQETHYVSATVSNQLMLCKIWGFHDSDYEEWRLLGYKNPVCTSQETHYVSTDVSWEPSTSIIRVTRIGELGTLAVTSNWHTPLWRNTMSFRTRATWRNIPEDGILQSKFSF